MTGIHRNTLVFTIALTASFILRLQSATAFEIAENFFKDEESNIPCSHFDSVDIDDGKRYPNGSVEHNGIMYAPTDYKEFNYVYKNHTHRMYQKKHLRGCICMYRKCIRSCCPPNQVFADGCVDSEDNITSFYVGITNGNESIIRHDLLNDPHYGLTYIKPCSGFMLMPHEYPEDEWHLRVQNDHVTLVFDDMALKNTHFCLAYNDTLPLVVACRDDELTEKTNILPLEIFNNLVSERLKRSATDEIGENYFEEEEGNKPCSHFDSVDIDNGKRYLNGSIEHNGIMYAPTDYKEFDYVYKNHTHRMYQKKHLRGCICRHRICIRSCCPSNQHFLSGAPTCMPLEAPSPFIVEIKDKNGDIMNHDLTSDPEYGLIFAKPCGGIRLEPHKYPEDEWHLEVKDNQLVMVYDHMDLKNSQYCLSYFYNVTQVVIAVTCTFSEESIVEKSVFLRFGMLVSVPFLLITFLVYAIIRELRASLHGKSLMCYVLCLTIGYTFLAAIQFNKGDPLPSSVCVPIGFIIYVSFLSSFLWLCVISFDIWWTFGKGGDHSGKRFLKYSLFAWGTAMSFMLLAMIMELSKGHIPDKFRPQFEQRCWFEDRTGELYYLYLPLMVIIILNVIFFGLTSVEITKAQNAAKSLTRGDSRKHNNVQTDKDKFGLYFRLFIIMGVTWSMEVVSWIFGPRSWFFIVTDLVNCIQGLLIFLLFVWKPRVRALIAKRYRVHRGLSVHGTNVTSRTSTSHVSMTAVEKPLTAKPKN